MPIQIPPGIGGVEPTLTLDYNSQGTNGPLGVGWSLSGLSAIERCPQTYPQDGALTGVNYSSSDRFCLDGQRLMLVVGTGSYGAAGSEYRTEIDSLVKVTAVGAAAGGGPASFVAKTKAGLTLEFGATADSSVEVAGRTPLVVRRWALSRLYDTKGNTMAFAYTKDTTAGAFNGAFYPQRIDYTSNSGTGLAAANSVVFEYEANRTDVVTSYQAGSAVVNQQRLKRIKTRSGGADVFVYTLDYPNYGSSARSRLASVTLCAGSGACLPATAMTFQPEPVAPSQWLAKQADAADVCLLSCGIWQTLDLNRDGRTDFVHLKDGSGNYSIWLSRADGTFTVTNYSSFSSGDTALTTGSWLLADLNGDGSADMVHLLDNAGHYTVWRNTGTGTFVIENGGYTSPAVDRSLLTGTWQVADVDGDGWSELLHFASITQVFTWKVNGYNTFAVTSNTVSVSASPGETCGVIYPQVLDVDGDGRSDVVAMPWAVVSSSGSGGGGAGCGRITVLRSLGDGTFATTTTVGGGVGLAAPNQGAGAWRVVDVNGDGLQDLVHQTSVPGKFISYISKGDGTFAIKEFVSTTDTDLWVGSWQILDYNGDGLADFIHLTPNPDDYRVWTSKGDGTFAVSGVETTAGADTCLTCGGWLTADLAGDGSIDLVHLLSDAGAYKVWKLPRTTRDVPSKIGTGLRSEGVAWTSQTLPQLLGRTPGPSTAAYSMSVASQPARWTVPIPISVVASATNYDGSGRTNTTTYHYDSARVERNGRGFLGFNWMQATDQRTSLTTRTYHAQEFPYIGLAVESTSGTSPSTPANLGRTTTQYGCLDPASAGSPPAPCAVSPGNRYLVYPSQITARQWDLNGAALPGTYTHNSQVDVFGNVGSVNTRAIDTGGNISELGTQVLNIYANDTTKWHLGRLLRSTSIATGPDVAPPVVPGSGGLPPAPAPKVPASVISTVLTILLTEDD